MVNTQRKITRYGSPWRVVYFRYTYGYGKAKYMDCESSLHPYLGYISPVEYERRYATH